jgi:hypothetical protein
MDASCSDCISVHAIPLRHRLFLWFPFKAPINTVITWPTRLGCAAGYIYHIMLRYDSAQSQTIPVFEPLGFMLAHHRCYFENMVHMLAATLCESSFPFVVLAVPFTCEGIEYAYFW